jgi:hypothetical protein
MTMSCRHDLALGTCRRCYPSTGTSDPGPEGNYEENLEGPGAITREKAPAPSRVTPNGVTLTIFTWLREQLAVFDPPSSEEATQPGEAAQLTVLARLAAIADAYEAGCLDEHRPEWDEKDPAEVELFEDRGGRLLLTLADAFAAREALHGHGAVAQRLLEGWSPNTLIQLQEWQERRRQPAGAEPDDRMSLQLQLALDEIAAKVLT